MANYYEYITGQGVIVPDTSVILAEIQDEFKAVFGEDLDLTATTPQGRLIELFQRNRTFCIQICALVSNMLNLGRASGFVLDDLGSLFLIERQPATHTITTVILSGVVGTIIPAGTRLQTSDGDIFTNTQSYVIGQGGTVTAQYQAVETGEIPCPADELTTILDRVNGLEGVTNPSAPVLGRDLESDTEFRYRIKNSLNINSIAVISAIKANLEAVNGVTDSYCYDNYTESQVTVDGVKVPAHSILACVEGGTDLDVATVLYKKKTLGTGYIKASDNTDYSVVEQNVIDETYGTVYPVTFIRPEQTAIDISVIVSRQGYSGADLSDRVKEAIIQWYNGEIDGVDGIKIGKAVSPFEISAAISAVIPDIFITDVKLAKHGQTLAATTLTFGAVHKATVDINNITVAVTQ